MKQLIKKILSLPKLLLAEEEWEDFQDILNNLPKKDGDEFKKALCEKILSKQKIKIKQDNFDKITEYMYAWKEMVESLIALNQDIVATWHNNFNEAVGNDILLPLTIELLPNNLSELKKVKENIEQAACIEQFNEIAFSIVNFISAIEYKLTINKSSDDTKILTIKNKIQQQETLLEQIQRQFFYKKEDVLQAIKHILINQLKMKYPGAPSTDSNYKTIDEMNDIIIAELKLKYSQSKIDYPELNDLFDKYFIIKDIYYGLHRRSTSTLHKLEEFYAKISQHEVILKDEMDTQTTGFLRNIYGYLPSAPQINKFLPNILQGFNFSLSLWHTQPKSDSDETIKNNPLDQPIVEEKKLEF